MPNRWGVAFRLIARCRPLPRYCDKGVDLLESFYTGRALLSQESNSKGLTSSPKNNKGEGNAKLRKRQHRSKRLLSLLFPNFLHFRLPTNRMRREQAPTLIGCWDCVGICVMLKAFVVLFWKSSSSARPGGSNKESSGAGWKVSTIRRMPSSPSPPIFLHQLALRRATCTTFGADTV